MPAPTAPRVLTRSDLDRLLATEPTTVLSIFHPTDRAAFQPDENSLKLKNLLGDVHEELEAKGMRRPEVDRLLEPLERLLDDREFWLNQGDGVAIFRTHDDLKIFRLPYEPVERVSVSDAPLVGPLLPALWPSSRFYILALSHNTVRLVHCTRFACDEIDLSEYDLPLSLDEALRWDDLQKGEIQHHPTTGPGRGPQGQGGETGRQQKGRKHAFHGHGDDGDEQKEQLHRFFRAVDVGLRSALLKVENVPLIVAGVDYLHPIFREVSAYPAIASEGIVGAIDRLRTEELHERALPIIEAMRKQELDELKERYGTAGAQGLASSDLAEILEAAHEGRIDTLFVCSGTEEPGYYDPALKQIASEDPAGEFGARIDLYDLAARRTIEASGHVFVLDEADLPVAPVCALFRYNPARIETDDSPS